MFNIYSILFHPNLDFFFQIHSAGIIKKLTAFHGSEMHIYRAFRKNMIPKPLTSQVKRYTEKVEPLPTSELTLM